MFKDRTTATIVIVAVIAIVIMVVVTLTSSPQTNPALVDAATTPPATTQPSLPLLATRSKHGAAFLANNAKDPDVHTTPSGLQYKVDQRGHRPETDRNRHGDGQL